MRINAVFEGGGVKGIALVGAIQAAERHGFTFHRMAGTSSGAIVASLLAAGYSAEEMKQLIMDTPFKSLARPTDWMRLKWIGPPIRLFVSKGLYSGDPLEIWIRKLLSAKGIHTFADLPGDRLRIVASDISGGKLMVLPDDLPKYGFDPAVYPVSQAVRMSCSLPFFFEPVVMRNAMKLPTYVVDGALLSNFPLWLFDQDFEPSRSPGLPPKLIPTVGFQLVGKGSQMPRTIRGPFTMLYALFATMMEAHDERFIEDQNRFRTIKIPTLGIRTTQFELSDDESVRLYKSGFEAGIKFFDRWSLSAYQKNFDLFYQKLMPKTKA